ncbi:hypothetical protein X801_02341 [Opisthorchis viverrini]|uniref:Peptidase A1 domain-containing protein n=1 Tax=Opisthorchis viverrini TaxID=6198 RepID=A0A1S8X4X0_OPIVI|nr:hypothetical protein X801_02341 [Opisthorchis viverrini]
MLLGSLPAECFNEPIVYVQLQDAKQWDIVITKIEYDDQIICELCNCLIDTGTPTTIMPHEAANRILRNSEIKDNGQGLFHVLHEDLPRVKDLKITIGVYVFVLPPKALLIRVENFHSHRDQEMPDPGETPGFHFRD